ncbi:MAG: isochorismatase family protein [Variovorax sp.]|nr:MAG: isochorismatase family protein [Variovorax sp.]
MSAAAASTALLVIDVQRALCEGPSAAFDADAVIARIQALAARARAAGAPVIFVQHEGHNGYLEQGADGWQLPAALGAQATDLRVRKTTPDSFHRTELQSLLERLGIRALVVCGMHTEFCVDTTTRRALALGYPVVLAADAHTTDGNAHLTPRQVIDHHNATLTNIQSFGPRVRAVNAADVDFQAG